MKVCVVGGGAREHALVDALSRTAEVVCAPGNPGMARMAPCVASAPEEIDADLFVIGPEAPLVDGLADRLRGRGAAVFGPGAAGARLEGSKAWMKDLLRDAGVPTAGYATFGDAAAALRYLKTLPGPWVIKTDGLAAGKGVLVTDDPDEAAADVRAKLAGESFGTAGQVVVIEEHLAGSEVSVLAICDGTRAVALPAAQDFKRVGDGDTGPNTGGMGAYSPVPTAGADVVAEIMECAVVPTLAALRTRGIDYRGILYAGAMLSPDGIRILEYNVRFGDPETEAVLPRVDDDLAAWLMGAALGQLPSGRPQVSDRASVTVVMASDGYPIAPRTGDPITGIERAAADPDVRIYHAGTALDADARLVTAGGRVLAVTGLGRNLTDARETAYAAVHAIDFAGAYVRHDIAAQAAKEEPQ
ncbi:MAG: phosphoribosylamine--glycine ligase [Acidimicrobiales bacterium]